MPQAWADSAVALYLPIGEAGDFSHPEALVYVDGRSYAACDRHHQEILLPEEWHTSGSRSLTLHGWTGDTHSLRFDINPISKRNPATRLLMGNCALVQIDQPTRELAAFARVLTLLRSPTDPDPTAGLGERHFTYSLLPHVSAWDLETIAAAYALNDPLLVVKGNGDAQRPLPPAVFISTNNPNVVIETIKRAEDGNGVIVRLYEYRRTRGDVEFLIAFPVRAAWRTNLLEENQEALVVDGDVVKVGIRPYQILTLRLS